MESQFENLQFVVFLQGAPSEPTLGLWKRMAGAEPQSFQPLPRGGQQATGIIKNFKVVLATQLGRVDLMISPNPPVEGAELEAGIELGLELGAFAASLANVLRVAVVLQSSANVSSAEAGVALAGKLAPIQAPAAATDLLYQILVPTKSKVVDGLKISRLFRLNVGRQEKRVNPILGKAANELDTFLVRYADVFVDTQVPIPPGSAAGLLAEAAAIAKGIVLNGYAALG